MRPMMLLEISDKALRGQGSDAEQLIATLRDEMDYEIGVFSGSDRRARAARQQGATCR